MNARLEIKDAYNSVITYALDARLLLHVQFRRLGVGRTLLELCDQAAKVAGKENISLHVRQVRKLAVSTMLSGCTASAWKKKCGHNVCQGF